MNPENLTTLVDLYGKNVYQFCMQLTHSRHDAEDLYQDTFLKAVEKCHKIDENQNPKAFLIAISIRLWQSRKRKYARRTRIAPTDYMELDQDIQDQKQFSLENQVIVMEEILLVQREIQGLNNKYQIPLYLYYTLEMSMEEIASALSIPAGTVKSRLFKARKLLKNDWRRLDMSTNKKNDPGLDRLIEAALSSSAYPDPDLNHHLKLRIEEKFAMNKSKSRVSLIFATLVFVAFMSVTGFAMYQMLSPGQVAELVNDRKLMTAFNGDDALVINESQVSGDYRITLLGIVSGEGLSDSIVSSAKPGRSYTVVAIENADGSPMPDTMDPDYGQENFFISPLVKGQIPWFLNIFTMNGASSTAVVEGVTYTIIETDIFEIFADRGVYLCVSTGSIAYNVEAFDYNFDTGEITPKQGFDGANVLFNLPLDISMADPVKAEAYLDEVLIDFRDGIEALESGALVDEEPKVSDDDDASELKVTAVPALEEGDWEISITE